MVPNGSQGNWGFRVASALKSGAGHMRRCLSLAEAIGGHCRFFLDPNSQWGDEIEKMGFEWEEEASDVSVSRTLKAISADVVQNVVFDSYVIAAAEIETAAKQAFCVEIIDKVKFTHAQTAVFPGLFDAGDQSSRINPTTLYLSGPQFALLAPTYAQAHQGAQSQRKDARSDLRVLVAMGAFDSANSTGFALDALEALDVKCDVTVVLGKNALHLDAIRRRVDQNPGRIHLIVGADDLASIIPGHDLAIVAGGVTLLEVMCCGVAVIALPFNDNQLDQAAEAERLGVAVFAGAMGDLTQHDFANLIDVVARDCERRNAMIKRALFLIDGMGAHRTANALAEKSRRYHEH